ncbi:cation:proton antiporter [Herbiconiux sp. VKM Ac-2851]|nr:cation:proton antiporter [Herbiconiux sp. VKM Ac-2851]
MVLLAAILISGLAHRTLLSTTLLFLGAGFLLGPGISGVLDVSLGDPALGTLSQLALFVVLFTDGQRIGFRDLRRAWRLPGRALLLGMPLAFIITTFLGTGLLGLPLAEALLVAAVLAPTDPVFASAIVGRDEIPGRVRSLLSIESGLNDGLALPAVIILIAATGGPGIEPLELGAELLGGIALGIAVPLIVGLLLRLKFLTTTRLYSGLAPAAIGIIVFGVSALTGANLYLAAFTAGITVASVMPEIRDAFREFGDYLTELVKLLAIFLFGALISPSTLADVSWAGLLFGILVLVVARPVAVETALIASDLSWQERLTAAWFGPKGFASVLYGLLVLASGTADAEHLFHIIVAAITLSIVAHSSTDVPIARYFAKKQTAANAP